MPRAAAALLALAVGPVVACGAAGSEPPVVDVPGYARVTGSWHRGAGARLFAGIRYAAAPVGDLRWRPPRPAVSVPSGELDATSFVPACPQTSGGKVVGSEDCLALNVYAPPAGAKSRPVLVWIHGGSYVKGTANIHLNGTWGPLYDGTAMAEKGAVVVTVQYRLGVFGYLGSSALRGRDPRGSSGNYGLQDQRLALQWVQAHIAAFGGDPERVLIFGQSTGAGSVQSHLISADSAGLFAAAAMQSGADATWNAQTMRAAEGTFASILRTVHCHDVECLARLPAERLVSAASAFEFAATVDGVEMEDFPSRLMEKDKVQKVPVIVGFNRDEAMAGSRALNMTEAAFDTFLRSQKVPGSLRPRVKAEYAMQYTQWYWAAQHFVADCSVACPARRFARAAVAAGLPVYAYKFSRVPSFPVELLYGAGCTDSAPAWAWGSYHGAELAFVFGLLEVPTWGVKLSAPERRIAEAASGHWLALASSGRPALGWRAYEEGRRQWLLLDSAGAVMVDEDHVLPQCDVADAFQSRSEKEAAEPLEVGGEGAPGSPSRPPV